MKQNKTKKIFVGALALSVAVAAGSLPAFATAPTQEFTDMDTVTLSESGVVEVNGAAQSGDILYPTYPKSLLSYPYAVPENSVFILGDYRTQAEDSRDFGPVQCSEVKAKVITLLRRRVL